MTIPPLMTAAVPVAVGGLVRSLVSSATPNGDSVVVWPVHAMLLGLLASWLAFLLILLVPVLRPLRHGPGEHLRNQDV